MEYERIIRKEKGYVPKKLEELRSRHKTALNCQFTTSQDDSDKKIVAIISEKNSDISFYNVKILRLDENCLCLLRCSDCKLCIHEACCDCYDSVIKGHMCKHIHYIAQKYAREIQCIKFANDSSEPDDAADLFINEDPAEKMLIEKKQFYSHKIQRKMKSI